MRNWRFALVAAVVLVPCGLLLMAQSVGDQPTTHRTWKSANGKYGLRVDETVHISSGSGRSGVVLLRTTKSNISGLAVAPDGTTSEQWQWTEKMPPGLSGYIPVEVAEAVVGETGKRFVLLGRYPGLKPTAFQRVIVILDEKGAIHAEVTADNWWKALGPDGKIADDPPKLRLLEEEKILEITFASGTTARVNVDSGEITDVKRAATAPASAAAATKPASAPGAK